MGQLKALILLATTSLLWEHSFSFVVPQQQLPQCVSLMAAGGNKKRRRRKEAPTGSTAIDPIKLEKETVEGEEEEEDDEATISTEEFSQFDLKPDGVVQGKASLNKFVPTESLLLIVISHRRFDKFLARH
jgi:hypothetical protein